MKPRVGRRETKCALKKKKKKRSPQRRRLYSGGGQMSLSTGERRGDQVAPVSAWGSQEGTEPPHPTRRWAGPLSYKRPLGDGHIAGGGCRAASEEATPGGEEPLGNPEGVRPGGSPVRGRGSSPVRGRGWNPVWGSGPEGARFGGGGGARFGGPARREPGSGTRVEPGAGPGVEPGSGVRRGGSPVRGRGRSPVRGRGAPRDPRGPGASRRLLACPALTHPAALPRRASRARQSAAERSSIPGSPRGLSLDRPGLEPPEGTASPGAHHLGGLRGGGAAASAALQVGSGLNASVCLLLVEEFYPEGLTKDTIM